MFTFSCLCPSVCEWVSLCVPKTGNEPETLWAAYLKNQRREFHPVLVTGVYGFVDVLVGFCGQKVKGQVDSNQWPESHVNIISHKPMKEIHLFLVTDIFAFWDVLIRFWGQRSRSQQRITRKPSEHHITKNNERNFTQFWPQTYSRSWMCWLDFGVKGHVDSK